MALQGKFSVTIPLKRTTPGTHLFQVKQGVKQAVQNVYVDKEAFERPDPPQEVKVTVEYVYPD